MDDQLRKILDGKKLTKVIVIYAVEGDEGLEADMIGYQGGVAEAVADLESTKFTLQFLAMKKVEESVDDFVKKFGH